MSKLLPLLTPLTLALVLGCKTEKPGTETAQAAVEPKKTEKAATYDQVGRAELNRLAAELALPIFWASDQDEDGAVDPAELAVLWGVAKTTRSDWVTPDGFTDRFEKAYASIVDLKTNGPKAEGLSPEETARRELIRKELSQGRPTLVRTDLRSASPQDKAIVQNVMEAAAIIEDIYAEQNGVAGMAAKIPEGDTASRMVFYRNQGPWCVAPQTEGNPSCNALPSKPKKISGLYPASLQEKDEKFCETLSKRKDADELMYQFNAVVEKDGDLAAIPYNEAYTEEMEAVAKKLEAAAAAIQGEDEKAFKAYLLAAAKAFRDNNWEPADEAWAKMNVHNSKWYLRIGPDEVYFEPCSRKAGFHVSFAKINQDSLEWQNKLDPVKGEMEQALAKLAGKPYEARTVDFHLPDFIDIVLNAGDSRSPHGATIGQSLPNWGPVANEGRGRTVAMTNLYTDPDSMAELEKQAKSLLCAETMKSYTRDPKPQVMATVLHEAAHNLGPAHEYKVKGKTASQIFGGPMASTLEELKAQTAALYFTDWLANKSLIDAEMAKKAHVRDIVWGFGHISRGMYTPEGKPKPYSQLAAIQFDFLKKEGAIEYKPEEMAANGSDKGCIELHLDRFPGAIEKLMTTVAGIKARGDKELALKLRKELVDAEDQQALLKTIKERWLRAPKASFVYAVEE